jgi:hypothetical protein
MKIAGAILPVTRMDQSQAKLRRNRGTASSRSRPQCRLAGNLRITSSCFGRDTGVVASSNARQALHLP